MSPAEPIIFRGRVIDGTLLVMLPVLAGAGLVIGVIVIAKALRGRSEPTPAPPEPPPPETDISDAGVPGGTG